MNSQLPRLDFRNYVIMHSLLWLATKFMSYKRIMTVQQAERWTLGTRVTQIFFAFHCK